MRSVFPESVSKAELPAAGATFLQDLARSLQAVTAVDIGIGRLADQVLTWHRRARDRRALGQLDQHLLHDIGLSRADVDHEVSKPFWQG